MQVMTTMEDPEAKQRERERTYEDNKRLQARQATRRSRAEEMADNSGLTTDFLDADDDDLDGNLGAIKHAFKDRQKHGSRVAKSAPRGGAARRPISGVRKRTRYRDDDDDDDDEGDDDDDEEDEDDGDPAEMDGFIVGDGDEEESEEEAESSGEDERHSEGTKQSRRR